MNPRQSQPEFEWDAEKDLQNQAKHGVSFVSARRAFEDPKRIIYEDVNHHTKTENRYFCDGMVDGMVMTVRFTLRERRIRIIGAGYWRKERKLYEERKWQDR